ncbi:MAG: ABC transporter permease [Deltaproteobacteria bacterium]
MKSIIIATFKEAARKKIFLFVGIITFIYLALLGLFLFFSFKELRTHNVNTILIFKNISLFISVLGFYFSSMLVIFLTIMISIGTISSEIESGAIHAIITKPIKRSHYVLGKYLGLSSLVIIYSCFLFASIIAICYLIGLPLVSSLGIIPVLKGFLFFMFEPLVILSLSVFGNTIFKTMTNGIFVFAIYILGLIGGMMEQIGSFINNNTLMKWGIFSSLISPGDAIYREMISTMFSNVGFGLPLLGVTSPVQVTPSVWMNLYIAFYMFGLLFLAIRKFNKKDIS